MIVYPKLFLNGGIHCIEILVTTVALILMYIVQVNREWKESSRAYANCVDELVKIMTFLNYV